MSDIHPVSPDPEAAQLDSAVGRVVAAIEAQIFSGELKDGESLPAERSIVETMGVSRPVAREAIKILGGKGLLDVQPRHRPIVRKPDIRMVMGVLGGLVGHLTGQPGGIRQIFDVRIFVEAGLVRQAALSAGKGDIARLREALEANRASIGDSLNFYRTDTAFHGVLYSIPANPIFPALHGAFRDWLDASWRKMPRLPERNLKNYQAHAAILEAILDRDPDRAEQVLRSHLEAAWAQVRDMFD
ncbi:FCD domain-containing protein [Pelagibacterium sediminicola]|uniref:FCD domain-containing protein n=1 Tax=Pelagibacterium sediminicola TaxID=2248761 RepID=UPI000E31E9E6|nr:FCD domain-containing protein [Pelagibacterium sediminicola]